MSTTRVKTVSIAELRLFGRNRTALFSALIMPLILAAAVSGAGIEKTGVSASAAVVTSLLGYVLLAAVYYNLVTTYVTRREDLVLKRLRAGELTDAEILTGIASPMVVVALGQMVVFVLAGALLFDLPMPVNPFVMLAGALGGVVVFVLLAAASTEFTRSTEAAQVTTLPVMLACLVGSMLATSLEDAPEALREDTAYFLNKMGLTREDFDRIMAAPPRTFDDYPSDHNAPLFRAIRRAKARLLGRGP